MNPRSASNRLNLAGFFSLLIPFLLFWLIVSFRIPESIGQYFHTFSLPTILIIFALYYFAFQLRDRAGLLVSLGLTMALTALSLSYIWSSGFSDNFLISGLVPYKDAKNYFIGSQLLLHGFPLVGADQGTERPLFPSFLASILFFTGQNLKITLAIITQLTAAAMYMSARQVRDLFGAVAASLFATLLYLYQPFIGYTMSETLGFLAGCLAFTMIWLAARSMKWQYLVPGVLVLLVAISARAGAFFIFPMLALWIGWIFRGKKRFSIKTAAFALAGMAIGYFLLNSFYARIIGIPPGSSFGNFSYALYGQVRGGTGWHSAIEDLGTRNPSIVYREAWQFFLKHPLSLAIGFAKAYRDFFGFDGPSMFPFGALSSSIWIKIILWLTSMSLLVAGLVRSLKNMRDYFSALILAGFAGILLSIPFLPPIDGGSRFYAGSAPFFFILPAVGINWFWGNRQQQHLSTDRWRKDMIPVGYFSIAILVITLIVPPLLYSFSPRPIFDLPSCLSGQEPFFIEYHPGSYVDLVKSEAQSCGFVPAVCQDDFERNNTEKSIDDFYQTLFTLMEHDSSDVRLIPALNFANQKFHYFYVSLQELKGMPSGAISGCAVEVPTRNQTIYQVKSWSLQK
jgi:hypothetical protein